MAPGSPMEAAGRRSDHGFVVQVRENVPFLPKVAFVVISLASLAGAWFTGLSLGVAVSLLWLRWLALWVTALTVGFLAWRLFYLRRHERDLDEWEVAALADTALARSRRWERRLAGALALTAPAPLLLGYMNAATAWPLALVTAAGAGLLITETWRAATRRAAFGFAVLALVLWGSASAGGGTDALVRVLHLLAFGLWVGGALWNLAVAIGAGRDHPVVDAVLAGARQLQRFRWVVRFCLPTIILTGLVQAGAYRAVATDWWVSYPGVLILAKVGLVVALVVIFITCPLYRQCSPVAGVCRVEDLEASPAR